ncbi:hypothetical protein J6A64_00330 [bacterium]|nr:hypothetical protein [bacterium]
MERILKFLLSIFVCIFVCLPVNAQGEQMSLSTLITAQNVSYENCYRVFNTDHVTLLYLTIAGINANRFTVDEIQTKSGYVRFTAVNKQFLAMISNVNTNQAMLKITPVDNNYYFQPGIVLNIFKYIEINEKKKAEYINLN